MAQSRKILLQLDTDRQPSVFDAIVALDAGVEHLLRHGAVTPDDVPGLVHGAIFTRGPADLRYTAIFVGGSDVAAAEALLEAVRCSFLGPMQVSVLLDANGANTTAAAAVVLAGRHLTLAETTALVLGGTGSVGQRVVRLLARAGAAVRVGSRTHERAEDIARRISEAVPSAALSAHATAERDELAAALEGVQLVIAAGAAGALLLPADVRRNCASLQMVIDLNAVPPLGIEGIEVADKAAQRDGVLAYGAIGVGGLKMKIHKVAIARLFESNDAVLDAEAVYELGCTLGAAK